ncbi:MAG: CBS domain-containing protein [archaeon]
MRHIGNILVKELMRKPITVTESTKIRELIKIFEDAKTDAVAVVDKNGKFIGDIHQHDLLKLLIDPKDASWDEVTGLFGRVVDMGYFAETAKDLMHKHELTVTPDTTIRKAVSLMFKHNVDALPVVDTVNDGTIFSKAGKLIGIITELEILERIIKDNRKGGNK